MMRGDYEEAQRLITMPQTEDSRMRTARYDAICSALRLRLHISQGEASSHPELVARLSDLYSRGRALGGQDTIVEMLWSAYVLSGRERKASALLTDYLSKHRRETFAPEWSLRQTTAADEAWIGAQRPDPEDINRKLLDLDFALSAGGNSQFQKSLASN